MKTALIWGVTGQDGAWLSDLLLSKEYIVYGVARRTSLANDERISHIHSKNFRVIQGDITDAHSVERCLNESLKEYLDSPADESGQFEVYNLAAQSHVRVSFDEPHHTWDVVAGGHLNVLEAVKSIYPKAKVYFAGSSEQYGSAYSKVYKSILYNIEPLTIKNDIELFKDGELWFEQNDNTPFLPRSPYAIAKLAAFHMNSMYREAYKIFACSGVLFNHESERRGETFVTRKITKYLAKLYWDLKENKVDENYPKLKLGNLNAKRDWGYAGDYVEAMWLMLQQKEPDDYIVAMGETHSAQEFLDNAFIYAVGKKMDNLISIDPSLFRPTEVNYLRGNPVKAKVVLGWTPKHNFIELIQKMVVADISREAHLRGIKDYAHV